MAERARRREQLLMQCELQRVEIENYVGALEKPIAVADRGFRILRYLRDRPLAVGAIVAVVAALRGRGLLKWGRRAVEHRGRLVKWAEGGLIAWRAWQSIRARRRAAS